MRKTITKLFLATFILTLGLFVLQGKIKAASNNIYYITASAGETYETAGINYHCNNANSYVLYGTSQNLTTANARRANPEVTEFEKPQLETDSNTGFVKRYVCKATLTGLSPSTTYYYKVVSGNEESAVYSFKSTAQDSAKRSFMILADIHASSETYVAKTQTTVTNVLKKEYNTNLGLITTAGDNVDRGGYEYEWKALFNKMTSFQNYLWSAIPGNHEYYHDNQPGYISPEYFNQFFNNPLNGPESKLNSSYYIKYGNALIIMLDVIKKDNNEIQKAWFKQVVENNPATWIIVISHPGCYSAGAYAYDAEWMTNHWRSTFEECQVDLAFSGHEHIYLRKNSSYKNEYNAELGTTYMVSPAAGMKQYPPQDKYKAQFDKILTIYTYAANVVTMSGNQLIVKLYDMNGNKVEEYKIDAKRPSEVEPMTDQEILDSLALNYDKENYKVDITWDEYLWGNVKNVEITCDKFTGDVWKTVISSPNNNSYTINAIYDTYDYYFTVTLTKTDNTTISKQLELINVVPSDPEPEPTPTPEPEKKGCKKKSLISIISLTSLLSAVLVIFRKKH